MKKIEIALTAGLVFSIFLASFTSFAKECDEIRSASLRLHILANSDSEDDQMLKLRIRDRILEQSSELFLPAYSKAQAKDMIERELPRIENTAREEVQSSGYDYPVKAELVNRYFETVDYDGFSMPAGRYDAVRVMIGNARGENWWCVLFPPLCIPAAGEKLPVEQQIERLGEQPRYEPKLAVLKFFDKISSKDKE